MPSLQVIDTGFGPPFIIYMKRIVMTKDYVKLSSAKSYFTRRKNRVKSGVVVRLKQGKKIIKEFKKIGENK